MEFSQVLGKIAENPVVAPDDDRRHDPVVKPKSADALRVDGSSALGEVVEYLHHDDNEKTFTRELVQDVEPILEHAKAMSSLGGKDAGKNKAGDFYLAGSFPVVVVEAWLSQRGLSMKDFKGQIVKDFLNDDAHSAFRIWKGRA